MRDRFIVPSIVVIFDGIPAEELEDPVVLWLVGVLGDEGVVRNWDIIVCMWSSPFSVIVAEGGGVVVVDVLGLDGSWFLPVVGVVLLVVGRVGVVCDVVGTVVSWFVLFTEFDSSVVDADGGMVVVLFGESVFGGDIDV